ncbi:hypothetical protein [Cellvibrio sp. NN19]|uniref:hypothetical protein n=1 Tax=Cellvibrio chitinivorans TaxID=3102792 RepID=UPI002B413E92|nr:hypothetical protein [Cellvibrio sp. NN19]
MKKRVLLSALVMLSSFPAVADSQWGLGLGQPYGGWLGVKYSVNTDLYKFYGSLGLLGYIESGGGKVGYSVGVERQIVNRHHSLGFSVGTVSYSSEDEYIGGAVNYSYYTAGFHNKSWIFGASVYSGERDVDSRFYDDQESGVRGIIGYQF